MIAIVLYEKEPFNLSFILFYPVLVWHLYWLTKRLVLFLAWKVSRWGKHSQVKSIDLEVPDMGQGVTERSLNLSRWKRKKGYAEFGPECREAAKWDTKGCLSGRICRRWKRREWVPWISFSRLVDRRGGEDQERENAWSVWEVGTDKHGFPPSGFSLEIIERNGSAIQVQGSLQMDRHWQKPKRNINRVMLQCALCYESKEKALQDQVFQSHSLKVSRKSSLIFLLCAICLSKLELL